MGKGSTIVVAASDLYEEAPIWYLRVKQAAERGATLIVANPRETKLDRYASFVVRYAYGDEVKTIQTLTRRGKIGDAFMHAENAVIFYGSEGLGLEGSTALASACARALNDTGHVGKPNNGLIGVWPRANDQGAWEIGCSPLENLQAAFDRAAAVYIVGADPIGDGALKLKSRTAQTVHRGAGLVRDRDRARSQMWYCRPRLTWNARERSPPASGACSVSIQRCLRRTEPSPILPSHHSSPGRWA